MTQERFCTKCGSKFQAVGREVICPKCKEKAMEEAKQAAVLLAKRKSWSGEAVPVRISGRASTVIRNFAKANDMAFVEALDELLKATDYVKTSFSKWEEITPYRSTRRKKGAEEEKAEEQEKTSVKPSVVPLESATKKKASRSTSKTKATK